MRETIEPFLREQGFLVLDGGLATQLESLGAKLDTELWSAELLLRDPGLIEAVHEAYYRSGADCATAASYQATLEGFQARGLSRARAEELLLESVSIALRARDRFWADARARVGRLRPLVAASVGPWGAFRADGSEFTGDYAIGEEELVEFHRPRWRLLARSGADLLACETIPAAAEARAYARLLDETPDARAWVSFCCRDEAHLSDGSRLADSAALFADRAEVVALGVNCTAPRLLPALLRELRSVTEKPLAAYPNSGERFDVSRRSWTGERDPTDFAAGARVWRDLGAVLIGGCCRTTPAHVSAVRAALQGS
jgi:homocysteine S-methyltransferase